MSPSVQSSEKREKLDGAIRYDFPIDPSNELSAYTWLLRFTEGAHAVLDVGCSNGFFSQHLVDRGCRVVGVERDPVAAKQARLVCDRVIVGDVESPSVQEQISERFDAVVLGDVLEHLRSPGAFLTHIRESWLKPDGRVALSVPNSGHWIFRREVLKGRFPYRQYGLFDRTHLWFFTRDSLYALVEDSGYEVEKSAIAINHNTYDDLTFACLAPLYRHPTLRIHLIKFEHRLASVWPTLFAYQFVFDTRTQ
jgi:SAM-dependent methyltransferase